MRLNQLSDNAGARKSAKRVGRGIGSGTGKTAGRGVKGQKSRSGVAIKGFEGGQMPIHMRKPKRGFNPPNQKSFAEVNVGRLQKFIDDGILDAKDTITIETLIKAGLVRRVRDGVRILAKGEIKAKVTLDVQGASKSAIEAVEKAGGKINIVKAPEAEPKKKEAK
jgi:large subunit ribosomal protein L15